jgi:hypothetical protein
MTAANFGCIVTPAQFPAYSDTKPTPAPEKQSYKLRQACLLGIELIKEARLSQLIKEWIEKRKVNLFPNVEKVAHFSPRAQLVTLDAYSKDDLPKALLASDHDRASEILATISHELTHWADVVGTVWGRGHIRRIYAAYRLAANRNLPGSEVDFPQLIELYDEERRLSFPTYYQVVEENQTRHGHNRPWIIGFTAGQEIDTHGRLDPTRPILFARFFDHDTTNNSWSVT